MNEKFRKLLDAALALPPADRRLLVEQLRASLGKGAAAVAPRDDHSHDIDADMAALLDASDDGEGGRRG